MPSAFSLRKFLVSTIDNFFPTECLVCNAPGEDLCTTCITSLSWPKPRQRRFKWITAIWNYHDDRVRNLVVTLKNKPHRRLAHRCVTHFMSQVVNPPTSVANWVLIPIPITTSRRRERGFNQSELLASAFQSALYDRFTASVPIYEYALIKHKTTPKQGTTKSREERLSNMCNAFRVDHPERIQGKAVIIIDDVTTTRATLLDAKRALREAGALKVLAWTLAN